LAAGVELRPVSSLAALAEGIPAPSRLALIDARRGEVFAALFEAGAVRFGPQAATPEQVAERASAGEETPLAAGDGAVRFRDVLEGAGIRVEPVGSGSHVVRGLHVCRLAGAAAPRPPEAVLPEYIRLPDAKPR
jgi:tRNA threonylcarbamoyladenosine biosynthesis protein TsaB